MNAPNLISLARVLIVPFIISLIISGEFRLAFVLVLLAGLSDALDGYLARQFGWRTELGSYLDPVADKLLLVSMFLTLGFYGWMPASLVVLVVSRDVLIVIAVVIAHMLGRPMTMRPHFSGKLNTAAQVALAVATLADAGFDLGLAGFRQLLVLVTAGLIVVSTGIYLQTWLRHLTGYGVVNDGPVVLDRRKSEGPGK
ncbi:MAG: CDP-alcohol phosphatidyltransferase family protein [Hyphomicrobiaceae bacterium]